MDMNIEAVKFEMETICRGCLSMNRALKPLQNNVHLFFAILGTRYVPEDSKYHNLLLCWECSAVLQRIVQYQAKIQCSLNTFLDMYQPISLSNLRTSYKNEFDYILEYSEETLVEIPNIKDEFSNDGIYKDESFDETDFCKTKEEVAMDILNFDDSEEKNLKMKKRKDKKKLKDDNMKVTYLDYDVNDIEPHIETIDFNLNEIIEMSSKEYNKYKVYDLRRYIESILKKKTKDYRRKENDEATKCSFCQKTTRSIRKHWDNHVFTIIKCKYCNILLQGKYTCLLHLKACHSKIYTCVCGLDYRSRIQYSRHYKSFHKTFTCDLCHKNFKLKEDIEKHMRFKHLPIKCEFCPRTFNSKKKWTYHIYLHHPDKQGDTGELVYCVECDIKFHNRYQLARHLHNAVAHKPKRRKAFPCPDCGRIFSKKNNMKNHFSLVHEKKSKYHCALCDKYFVNAYSVRCHKKFVHDKAEMPRNKICHICTRAFTTNKILVNHIRTHTGERPFKCGYCDVAFAQVTAMKTHEKTQHKRVKLENE